MRILALFLCLLGSSVTLVRAQNFYLGWIPSPADATNHVNGYSAYWMPTNNFNSRPNWMAACAYGTTNVLIPATVPNGSWLTVRSTIGTGTAASDYAQPVLYDTNLFAPLVTIQYTYPAPAGLNIYQQ